MKSSWNRACAHAAALVSIGAAAVALGGCTSLLTPLGSEYYDCNRKENPSSPYCHSFRSVTDGTNAPIPDSRYDMAVRIEDVDRLTGIAPTTSTGASVGAPSSASTPNGAAAAAPRPTARGTPGGPSDGTPVRVPALVQRTWIKRHVEEGDRLVGSTYVYREVTHGHWAGFAASPSAGESYRGPNKPHYPSDEDVTGIRAAAGAANKGATALASRVKSGLSQPGLATPAGEVVAPPIDGASMPQ